MLRIFRVGAASASILPNGCFFQKHFETTNSLAGAAAIPRGDTLKRPVADWTYKEIGEFETKEWRGLFYSKAPSAAVKDKCEGEVSREWNPISPWHDLPRVFPSSHTLNGIGSYRCNGVAKEGIDASIAALSNSEESNFSEVVAVVEIPQGSFAKLEMSKELPYNPIVQDVYTKKPNQPLRYLMYEPEKGVPFHYGFIPRTFEDPLVVSAETGCPGDGDPLDVVFLDPSGLLRGGTETASTKTSVRHARLRGSAWRCKVLGVLPLIDEGETDWKVIVEPLAPLGALTNTFSDKSTSEVPSGMRSFTGKYKNISDVPPDLQDCLCRWFRYYKTCDGKPENAFAMNGKLQYAGFAAEVVKECAAQYDTLLLGKETTENERSINYWF